MIAVLNLLPTIPQLQQRRGEGGYAAVPIEQLQWVPWDKE